MHTAYIALGGNLGDVLGAFAAALRALHHDVGRVVAVSPAYRTRAVMADAGELVGPDYWNAAAALRTALSPVALLAALHAREAAVGRVRHRRWEARPLDLDLLLVDDVVMHDAASGLVLPHPRTLERTFVLLPLCDIAPHLVVPGTGGVTVKAGLLALGGGDALESRKAWIDAAGFVS